MLEVAVGQGACSVLHGDEVSLDVSGERLPPDAGLPCVVTEDATHSSSGSIGGPKQSGLLGHDLS